jgi:hypothetical protein
VAADAEAECDEPLGTPLSTFAHTMNTDFIDKVTSGRAGQFVPSTGMPAVVRADGSLSIVDASSERFFTYVTDNGWNNQILNLLCALDMARLLNRTLIVPPFAWVRRRGDARVSVARLLDLSTLARLGVRVLCEDEHGSVDGLVAPALAAAGRSTGSLIGGAACLAGRARSGCATTRAATSVCSGSPVAFFGRGRCPRRSRSRCTS